MEVISFFKKRNNYFVFLSIAVVLYGVVALKSDGFFQMDEHYQIIEFAQLISGEVGPETLPWEFREKMRPAMQPMIAYGVFSVLEAFAIENPYTKAFVLRLLTALLALVAIHNFVKVTENQVDGSWGKRCYYFLAFFLYFLPYINVRFSSEAWSGLFLLLGVSYVLRKQVNYYVLGLILGLAFLFRFQIAFAVLGLILYLYFSKTAELYDLIKVVSAIILVTLLGVALDSWFYGEFVFSQWNYVYQNVALGKAAKFGVSPWYGYLIILLYLRLMAVGVLVLLALMVMLRFQPKHMILWIVISSILLHSLVARKDVRFLFPLVNFVPLLFVLAGQTLGKRLPSVFVKHVFLKRTIAVYLMLHFCFAAATTVFNRNKIVNNLSRYVYEAYRGSEIELYYYGKVVPEKLFEVHPVSFYYDSSIHCTRLSDINEVKELEQQEGRAMLVWFNEREVNPLESEALLQAEGYQQILESTPNWMQILFKRIKGEDSELYNEVLYLKTNRESEHLRDQ